MDLFSAILNVAEDIRKYRISTNDLIDKKFVKTTDHLN
jgi:hypothetical protein